MGCVFCMLTISQMLTGLTLIGGGLVGLSGLYYKVLRPVYRAVKWLFAVIDSVNAQFYRNGGSSLRDRVDGQDIVLSKQNKVIVAIGRQTGVSESELKPLTDMAESDEIKAKRDYNQPTHSAAKKV